MKHLSKLFLLLLSLNFVAPTQKLQANNSDWIAKQIDNPVFSQQDPNSGYPQITITSGQSRSRIPSPMAGKSNLPATLQDYNFIPVPNLKTGTVQDFELYFEEAKLTIEEALNWHAAYVNDNYIAIIKELSDYDQKLNKLKREYNNQSDISEWFSRKFGSQPENFKNRLDELYSRRIRERGIEQAARIQAYQLGLLEQTRQKSQATVRQAWPENFELLQQDIPEWQVLNDIFLEHKFGDSARLQKRITVLSQLSANNINNLSASSSNSNSINNLGASNNSNFITQSYKISPEINHILQDTGLNPVDYTNCYGNPFQQLIHQENLDQLQQLDTLSPLSPIFYHKPAIVNCVDSAREYNHTGLVHDSVTVTDFCWALLDYSKIACQGVVEGIYLAAKDLVDHPDVVLMVIYAQPQYVIAYQLTKVAVQVAKIGITALTDPIQGQAEWDDYIAPLNNMIDVIRNKQLTLKDATKLSAALAAGWYTQGRLLGSMNQFFITTKTAALQFKEKHPRIAPQQYLSTSDGQLLKATKLTGSERKKLREQRAATQITEFMTELPKETLDEAIRYAKIDNNFKHYFKEKHKLTELVEILGSEDKVLEAVLNACVNKIPATGVFKDIPIIVRGYTVLVRGRIINGVPYLGTMFIK